MLFKRFFSLSLLVLISVSLMAQDLSPLDFGLDYAKSDLERYKVLMLTHITAKEKGYGVSYEGIERVTIEIPKGASSIPLAMHTNFAGAEIIVRNNNKKFFLFSLDNPLRKIVVSKEIITSGKYDRIKELRKGEKILVIEDEMPWVKQRKGYNYGANRRDVLLLKRGKQMNLPVSPYSDKESRPICSYCDVTGQKVLIENLHFVRSEDSHQITHLISLSNQNNIILRNITVDTPEDADLFGDVIIGVSNCTNIKMEDISINGTYSKTGKFGYGIQMNNVWNTRFVRLNAHGNWGVFGNSNVNYAVLEDCDINRFDIHCYGRDVFCYRTTFRNQYNQFSSLFGELVYDNCVFDDFIPVLFEASYSAYTPFDMIMKDCIINVKPNRPYLFFAGNLMPQSEGVREKLHNVAWPNVRLENVTVILPRGEKIWTLFQVNGNALEDVDYVERVTIKNVRVIFSEKNVKPKILFSNNKVKTKNTVKFNISQSSVDNIEY